MPKIIKHFWNIFFYLFKGLYLHYFKEKYDVIITYGYFTTGLTGCLLKICTGAKLIVEVPGNPQKLFLFDSEKLSIINRFKNKIGYSLAAFTINLADHIKLLYPDHLNGYKKISKTQTSIFHDFVPINVIKPSDKSDKYILFLGYPWFLKGVDILIKSFKLISNEFPEYRLKIVGFCPDKSYFQKLAEGNNRIELCDAVLHDEATELMFRCALFVLPSRTETMGRVLLEAMASKKPIVASNVDGIPHYIKHGLNGLLFESKNVADLAEKIRIILKDGNYAKQLAENGYKYVHSYFSEECYVTNYRNMIEEAINE